MAYALTTTVPVEKTQAEIKKLVQKQNPSALAIGEAPGRGVITFEAQGWRFRFDLPLPTEQEKRGDAGRRALEQKHRSRWRALLLVIKAKFEAVEAGITTIEQEFMAQIVLPDNRTIGQVMPNQIAQSYEQKKLPPLLGFDYS